MSATEGGEIELNLSGESAGTGSELLNERQICRGFLLDSGPAEGGGGGLSCGGERGRVGGRRQQPIVRVGAAWPTRGWGHRAPRAVHGCVVRLSLQGHNLFVQIPLIKLSNNGHVLCPSLRLK